MSVKAKGTSIEKIKKEFQKFDVDEKIEIFHDIKKFLNDELEEAKNKHEEKVNSLQSTIERINGTY